MMMTDSQNLLAEYAANGSETAFRELVSRYVNLVHSTARRLVDGDSQLAEDVTQMVFISLAKKGRALSREVMLGGWLHQHTYHLAMKAIRSERRRQSREREAVEMNVLHDNAETDFRHVAPLLDEAITQLGSEDRKAILLRFFERRDFRAVGQALGSNEDAARMRVNRALGKLHSLLRVRGVSLSVATLGSVLLAEAVTAAPAGLALAASSAALGSVAAVGGGGTTLFVKLMAITKLKFGVTALVIAGAATTLVVQHQSQVSLREENQSLLRQVTQLNADKEGLAQRVAEAKNRRAPRLPAPVLQVAAVAPALPAELLQATNLYGLVTNQNAKLTVAQIESYLAANKRNAASLLAGFRTTGDPALLEEAMKKYPNDPQVSFEAVVRKNIPPEERRQWLDAFKQSDPNNALANYLSANDYFKAGRTDQAVQELIAVSGKPGFQDYSRDRVQDDEEAYRAAGYPMAESKLLANARLLLPQLAQMKGLGQNIIDLANSYRVAGDAGSAQSALQMAASLGQHYSEAPAGETLISRLVGIAVERNALSAMEPNSPYGSNGQTVQERLNQLTEQKTGIQQLAKQVDPILQTMSADDWMSYNSRSVALGEEAAMRWIVGKRAQQ